MLWEEDAEEKHSREVATSGGGRRASERASAGAQCFIAKTAVKGLPLLPSRPSPALARRDYRRCARSVGSVELRSGSKSLSEGLVSQVDGPTRPTDGRTAVINLICHFLLGGPSFYHHNGTTDERGA